MANEIRLRRNNIAGTITDNPLPMVSTTINSPGFVDLPVVDGTNHMILILDPLEVNGTAEIVMVTAHTVAATSVTVTRGAEGSTPRAHIQGTTWFHGPVVSDYNYTQPTALSTNRPAAPFEGELIYETDTNRFMGYTGADWASRDAGGTLAYAQVTANQTGIVAAVALTGLSATITVPTGRRIKVTGYGVFSSAAASAGALMFIQQDSVTVQMAFSGQTLTAGEAQTVFGAAVLTPSAGSHTYRLLAQQQAAGPATLQASATQPAYILIEDIGAA